MGDKGNSDDKSAGARWAFLGAVIAAIITGIVTLIVAGKIPFFNTPANATQTAIASIPTANPGSILLAENFEDGRIQNMSVGENSGILVDDTGNKVFDVDNSNGNGYPGIGFGDISWSNYELDYRIKFISTNNNSAFLEFRRTCDSNGACQRYILSLDSNAINLHSNISSSDWLPIEGSPFEFKPQTWYSVRLAVNDTNIRVYIDNSLILDAVDARIRNGSFLMQTSPKTHVQFDDFLVIALGK